jgi:hypothetical protein
MAYSFHMVAGQLKFTNYSEFLAEFFVQNNKSNFDSMLPFQIIFNRIVGIESLATKVYQIMQ